MKELTLRTTAETYFAVIVQRRIHVEKRIIADANKT